MHRRLRIVLGLLAIVVVATFALEIAIRCTELPKGIYAEPPATPSMMDMRGRVFSVISTDSARESHPLALREMGGWLPMVTVGIEDHRFWAHRGVDIVATSGATLRNLKHRKVISGASTITQQLIKNASQRTKRTLSSKVYEALASAKLERIWNKKRILETYMNRLDYGNRRIGPEAAALAYFGKSADDLSLAEAIFLAGLPQSPARLNPWRNPAGAQARYEHNVKRLAQIGLLPAGTDVSALLNNPPRVQRNDPPQEAPRFAEAVGKLEDAIAAKTNRRRESAAVQTNLDLDLQRVVERLLREHLKAIAPFGANDCAIVVVENATGNVRAMASTGESRHAALNAATEPRSCGSTLKPFLYLAAIDQRRLTAASLLPDTPDAITEEYRDYDPQNYSKRYFGPVRLREALGNSMNVPAVVTLSKLGARDTFEGMRGWGLDFPQAFDAYGAGFILGNAQVRLVDLAGAYAGLARGGDAWKAKLTPWDPIESRTMASREACAIITDVLCDNQARILSFGNSSPLHLEQRTAVKTGTSSGFRDGWCAGFNGRHTVAVWTGNLDGKPMGEMLAVRSAAPLWAATMRHLYAKGDPEVPAMADGEKLHHLKVAKETGLLPRPSEQTVDEWFLSGTEPTVLAETCYADGVLVLPQEYASWCASAQNRLGAVVRKGDLKILFPKDGAVFEFNPHLPQGKQVMPLQATAADCQWFLNGRKLEAAEIPLTRGEWHLVATSPGQTASVSYVVQ